MTRSETCGAILKAFANFQAEAKDPSRDGSNPHFKCKYVTLDALLSVVRPALAKHGLSFVQEPSGDGQTVTITTILLHESGEWLEFAPFTLKPTKADPQGVGSALTYARRYSLSSILGLAWDSDDDGNAASEPQKQQAPAQDEKKTLLQQVQNKAKSLGISVTDVAATIRHSYGVESSARLTIEQVKDLFKNLQLRFDIYQQSLQGAA